MTRRKLLLMLFSIIGILVITSCNTPNNELPERDNNFDYEEDVDLPIQSFENALEAFRFGRQFFKDTPHFRTISHAHASLSIGGSQNVTTHRALSDNGNFLYKTANLGSVVFGIDPNFTFMVANPGKSKNVYYRMLRGRSFVFEKDNEIIGDFSQQSLNNFDTVDDMGDIQQVMGVNPRDLSLYFIDETTVMEDSFTKNPDGSFTFSFGLNEGAVINSRRQVEFFSRQTYRNFRSLKLAFEMDTFGRILEIRTNEEYQVAVSLINPWITLMGVEFISYRSNPLIDFDDFSLSEVTTNNDL